MPFNFKPSVFILYHVRALIINIFSFAAIMNWSSNAFYNNELVAHQSVATHLLKDLPGVKSDENTGTYFTFELSSVR